MVSRGGAETNHQLQKLVALRSQNDIELRVEEFRKRRNQIKIGDIDCIISDFDTHKNEIIEELKNLDENNLEDMVFRMELTYKEIEKLDWNILQHHPQGILFLRVNKDLEMRF